MIQLCHSALNIGGGGIIWASDKGVCDTSLANSILKKLEFTVMWTLCVKKTVLSSILIVFTPLVRIPLF